MIWLALALVVLGFGVFLLLKRKAETAPVILDPLPLGARSAPAVFCPWMERDEGVIAKHGLYWDIAEAYGVHWVHGTSPNLAGVLDPSTVVVGLAKRSRLKTRNPDIQLGVQIGYTEGVPDLANFPVDHAWWKRDAQGRPVHGWADTFLFNLNLPEVRQHCAMSCKAAMDSGVWDFLMLDTMMDDANHVDILRRVRALLPAVPVIVNCNARICPNIVPFVNGVFMECGTMTAMKWPLVQQALDFNERHVRQPAMNCVEISGARTDLAMMRAATCFVLARSNAYLVYADPGPGYASTHLHLWYDYWNVGLGHPVGPTMAAGKFGSQRRYEHGNAIFLPPPGDSHIALTAGPTGA